MSARPRDHVGIAWAVAVFVLVMASVVLVLAQIDDEAPLPDQRVPAAGPPDPATVSRAMGSTVLIRGLGCGLDSLGTGAVIEGGVVTNAHVVAGTTSVQVESVEGELHDAAVVALDPIRDLALLDAPGLAVSALDIGAPTGGDAAVVLARGVDDSGEAGIQPVDAVIERTINITISDIYGEGRFDRRGLELEADIGPGDSGAPVINARGEVVGVVFSASRGQPDVAYAISGLELEALVDSRASAPVETGECR